MSQPPDPRLPAVRRALAEARHRLAVDGTRADPDLRAMFDAADRELGKGPPAAVTPAGSIDLIRPIWEMATGSKPHTFAVFRARLGEGVDIRGPGGVVQFFDPMQGSHLSGIPIEGLNALIPNGTHIDDVPIEAIRHIFYSLMYMRVVVAPDARGVTIRTSE